MKGELVMVHENARAGFGKLFTAQVLGIIAAFCSLLTLIPGIGPIIAGAAIAILGLIGYIMQLVGLNQAGKDEDLIKSAFGLAIFSLILGVVGGILGSVFTSATWISSIVNLVNEIISLVIVHHVLFGGANLNSALSDKAASTWKIVLTVIIIDIIVTIGLVICGILGGSTASAIVGIVVIVLTIVDVILDLISFFMYLSFLSRAKNEA
jgi:hypothetical protein